MTPEELNRAIEFIIQQQAKFESDMQLSKERFEAQRIEDQPRIARLEQAMIQLVELTALQSRRLDEHAEWIRRHDVP